MLKPSLAFARRPLTFLGEVLLSAGAALGGRRRYRAQDAARVLADTSARAVGIVCLVNFLVGAILAFVDVDSGRRSARAAEAGVTPVPS